MTGHTGGEAVLFLAIMALASGYVVLYGAWLVWRWWRDGR